MTTDAKDELIKLRALIDHVIKFIDAAHDDFIELPATVEEYKAQNEKLADQLLKAAGGDPDDLYDSFEGLIENLSADVEMLEESETFYSDTFLDWIERPDRISWKALLVAHDAEHIQLPLC